MVITTVAWSYDSLRFLLKIKWLGNIIVSQKCCFFTLQVKDLYSNRDLRNIFYRLDVIYNKNNKLKKE